MVVSMKRSLWIMAMLALAGCATLPSGPSVKVLPGEGKSFEEFQADDALCMQWAGQRIGMNAQELANQHVAGGAVAGTLVGGGIGAALGAASGNPGAGAAIGAGSGLLIGTAAGADSGRVYGWEAQRRYDIAYEQCMYAKGNQIPGIITHRGRRTLPPPPPGGMYPVPPDYVPSR